MQTFTAINNENKLLGAVIVWQRNRIIVSSRVQHHVKLRVKRLLVGFPLQDPLELCDPLLHVRPPLRSAFWLGHKCNCWHQELGPADKSTGAAARMQLAWHGLRRCEGGGPQQVKCRDDATARLGPSARQDAHILNLHSSTSARVSSESEGQRSADEGQTSCAIVPRMLRNAPRDIAKHAPRWASCPWHHQGGTRSAPGCRPDRPL